MRLQAEQLPDNLKGALVPVYLISGDEPWQLAELSDSIRAAARKQDYLEREVLSVEAGFVWEQLAFLASSGSIFGDKKLIDLRMSSPSPGAEGAKALLNYCQHWSGDSLLLITTGKLASSAFKSAWLESINKHGVIIQVWPLEGQALLNWLQLRMSQRGLLAENNSLKLLAERVEGNLLAAAQEIEKLYVLYGAGPLSSEQILEAVADNSRYDVFKLVDALLAGYLNRALKIIYVLQAEGIAVPVVLWALTKEARLLIKLKRALADGQSKDLLFKNHQIWDKRKVLVDNALHRLGDNALTQVMVLAAKADRQSKGQQSGSAWETLIAMCCQFAGVKDLYSRPSNKAAGAKHR
jgi:DNA polymerase-3 subunit delta